MSLNSQDAKNYLLRMNEKLTTNNKLKLRLMSKKSIDAYFDNMRIVFHDFLKAMLQTETDDERRVLILEMCDINALYNIKIKLERELPADLAEIAYDFDNPDYPGAANIYDKIKCKRYLLQA